LIQQAVEAEFKGQWLGYEPRHRPLYGLYCHHSDASIPLNLAAIGLNKPSLYHAHGTNQARIYRIRSILILNSSTTNVAWQDTGR